MENPFPAGYLISLDAGGGWGVGGRLHFLLQPQTARRDRAAWSRCFQDANTQQLVTERESGTVAGGGQGRDKSGGGSAVLQHT